MRLYRPNIVTGIILEVIDYHIDVICRYKINKRIFLKMEILNVAYKSQIVMSEFTTKHCLIMLSNILYQNMKVGLILPNIRRSIVVITLDRKYHQKSFF